MFFVVLCGFEEGFVGNRRYYGPFATMEILNLWLESHAPTDIHYSVCDENIHRHHHTVRSINDPMKGISKRAKVDVTHALTGA